MELERCKKKASASAAKWKEHANDADSLKLEIEELKKCIETTESQLQGGFHYYPLLKMNRSTHSLNRIVPIKS